MIWNHVILGGAITLFLTSASMGSNKQDDILTSTSSAPKSTATVVVSASTPLLQALPTSSTSASSSSSSSSHSNIVTLHVPATAEVDEKQQKSLEKVAPKKEDGKGLSLVSSPDEPEYIKRQRILIQGKKFSINGIVLFSGTDPFSAAIRLATASDWSHVGMVLADTEGKQYCFESTGAPGQILHDGMLPQVQINTLDDVVKGYEGSVSTRTFTFDKDAWTSEKTNNLTNFVLEKLGTAYERNIGSLLKAIKGDNQSDDSSTLFCSELTALTAIEFGLLPKDGQENSKKASNYLPRDFSGKQFLPWIHAKLGAEKSLKQGSSGCCPSCTIL